MVNSTVEAIAQAAESETRVAVPAPLSEVVPQAGWPMADDQRLPTPDDPLLIVEARAMATHLELVAEVTSQRVRDKLLVDTTSSRNYLLLWSQDAEFHYMFAGVCKSLLSTLEATPRIPYDEVYLFALPRLDQAMTFCFTTPPDRRHG